MHLNDDQIQPFLHGELEPRAREALSLHVAECNACANRLAEAEHEESEIFGLLGRLDHPAPRVDPRSLTGARGAMGVWGRRVAALVAMAILAGAAYAIPGSPLPTWLKKAAELIAGERELSSSGTGTSADAPPVTSGIAVPVSEHFAIVFLAEQSEGAIVVSLTDGSSVVVRAIGGAVTFTTDADRLTVDNRDSLADYEIEIPRAAKWVEIHVDLRRIVVKEKDQFASGLERDPSGRAVLRLHPTE